MAKIPVNGVEIYYEQYGDPTHPAVLLIAGLGAQIVSWSPDFLASFTDAGFFLTVFDNRDVGLSTWLTDAGTPDALAILSGEQLAPYFVGDMARDAAELVEALRLGPVHVIGQSMGGMIAQQFAIDHPHLTRTLTSIMSSPNPMEVGEPTPEVMESLFTPRSEEFEESLEEEIVSWQLTNGTTYPIDEAWIREQATLAWQRGRNPAGVMRQMAACATSPDRRPLLAGVSIPALVVHGDADPFVTLAGGEATAAALKDVRYVVYPGMGHAVPRALWPALMEEFVTLTKRVS